MGIDATDPENEKPVQLIPDGKKPLVGYVTKKQKKNKKTKYNSKKREQQTTKQQANDNFTVWRSSLRREDSGKLLS